MATSSQDVAARRNERRKQAFHNDPEFRRRHLARAALGRAVKRGEIERKPCCCCGSTERVHAHHPDYDKPFSVAWLCQRCHELLHHRYDPQAIAKVERAIARQAGEAAAAEDRQAARPASKFCPRPGAGRRPKQPR